MSDAPVHSIAVRVQGGCAILDGRFLPHVRVTVYVHAAGGDIPVDASLEVLTTMVERGDLEIVDVVDVEARRSYLDEERAKDELRRMAERELRRIRPILDAAQHVVHRPYLNDLGLTDDVG